MRYLISCRLAPCSETRLDAVRHAGDVVEADEHGNAVTWRESYAPGSLRLPQRGATVEFGHDSEVIGSVITVGSAGGWIHADCVVESDDEQVMARIRPGTPVSLGGRALATDTDYGLLLRRHVVVEVEHVAIAREGERGTFDRAVITSVRETKAKAARSAGALSDVQARDELRRRVDSGEEWYDVYESLGGLNRPNFWYLPTHVRQGAAA